MKRLNKFSSFQIQSQTANHIKGGTNFCEWYITQKAGNGNTGNASILMEHVDDVMTNNGNPHFS